MRRILGIIISASSLFGIITTVISMLYRVDDTEKRVLSRGNMIWLLILSALLCVGISTAASYANSSGKAKHNDASKSLFSLKTLRIVVLFTLVFMGIAYIYFQKPKFPDIHSYIEFCMYLIDPEGLLLNRQFKVIYICGLAAFSLGGAMSILKAIMPCFEIKLILIFMVSLIMFLFTFAWWEFQISRIIFHSLNDLAISPFARMAVVNIAINTALGFGIYWILIDRLINRI